MTRYRAIFIISFMLVFAASLPAGSGIIGGTLKNEWGDPLVGGIARIPGQHYLAIVGHRNGSYELNGLPPGIYDVLYEHAAYNSLLLRNVEVGENAITELHVILNLAEGGASIVDTVVLELTADTTALEPDSLDIEAR
ncbi:carboxypeptidase-like regulatory domain-containing protein [bacterium]|nr:carboxypeptidase-like regulatory domain-containing protein [bacterium]MBU1637307.1 carboxypeptidase-like regulatory domain-containing protein [bacterium]